MKTLRTPDKFFKNLKNYNFVPNYSFIETNSGFKLRIHHIDEGPKDGPILLAMHGQPVWSYLYSKMIPYLIKEGIRVIAPDLPGYGKSDKPSKLNDYSYQNQVDWMTEWLKINDFKKITLFGQDWGGLIGLRIVANDPERFSKVAIGNTGLPYNPNISEDIINQINEFRSSKLKLTPLSMMKHLRRMDDKHLSGNSNDFHPALKFMYWQKFCWDTRDLPIGFMMSIMMEKRSRLITALHYLLVRVRLGNMISFGSDIAKAYEAPFPNSKYKMGPRAMPSHVPTIPDESLKEQKKAREFFSNWDKPFLSVFAGDDPVTNGIEKDVLEMCPNAKSSPHIGGGHFFQWTRARELSTLLTKFIKEDNA
tara:strand:- start:1882 stop:2973 length:1092 start_codon:yes stop_codon:yes gene_type:complete